MNVFSRPLCSNPESAQRLSANLVMAGQGGSAYARIHGLLLQHRIEMRIMGGMLEDVVNEEEYEAAMIEQTGNTGLWLGECGSECRPSCPYCKQKSDDDRVKFLEAENALLRRELQDRQNFIIAVKSFANKPQSLMPIHVINKDKMRERVKAAFDEGKFTGCNDGDYDKVFGELFPEIVLKASGGFDKGSSKFFSELIHFEPPASTAAASTAPPPIIQEAATGKDFNATWLSMVGPGLKVKAKKDKKDKK